MANMPRKLRLEFPGAIYHVINRGNYRRWIFADDPTKAAFESCLFEACARSRWLVHAFVIMGNHFHLAVETPEGNLVAGMQWLQSTFANRFNRFRSEHGHLFQARYKSLLVEAGTALGQVCNYLHLNPVRGGIVAAPDLQRYRYSSYWYLHHPLARPRFLLSTTALAEAGALADTPAGRRSYGDFLSWQATEGPAGKNAAYATLSRGWAPGTAEFKAQLIDRHGMSDECRAWGTIGAREVREHRWRQDVTRALAALGKTVADARRDKKSAHWKLAIAAWMKTYSQARTEWLADTLFLGAPAALSRNLTLYRRQLQQNDPARQQLLSLSAA